MQHIVDLQLLSSHLLTRHEPDPDVGPLSWEEDASDRLHLKVFWRGFLPHLPPYMEGHVLGDLREGEGHTPINYCREHHHTNCVTFFDGLSVMAVHSHLYSRRDRQDMSKLGQPHTAHCLCTTRYRLHVYHFQLPLT